MNNLDQIICNDYKMPRINSVTHNKLNLILLYKLFRLLLEPDPPVNEVHIVQECINCTNQKLEKEKKKSSHIA